VRYSIRIAVPEVRRNGAQQPHVPIQAVLDPATLDEATLLGLLGQYGPVAAEQAEAWFLESIDPTTLSAVSGPKFECKGRYGCEYWTQCRANYIPSVTHSCYVDDCGPARCRTCPEFANELLRNLAIKSWCSYVCMEDGTSNVVAVGAGAISAFRDTFVGALCIPYP
jgi:hypothetical protein